MFTVTRSGSMQDAIQQVRDIPARVIPYAASTALTKSAQAAKEAIVGEMGRVFDRPVAYTLNALRVVSSTVETLSARVAVKDQGARVPQENYLLPEVEGGRRREKGVERALRYAGYLRPGEFAVPGHDAPLDANGNMTGALVRTLIRAIGSQADGARRAPVKGGSKRATYFVAALGRKRTRGVWKRTGRTINSMLIFVTKAPTYRPRLDFTGIAQRATLETFPAAFAASAASIIARRSS